jgi:hypothetical protein
MLFTEVTFLKFIENKVIFFTIKIMNKMFRKNTIFNKQNLNKLQSLKLLI